MGCGNVSVELEKVYYCDLCGAPTGSFHYYEVKTSALGVLSETSLAIDICKECAKKVQHEIPSKLMIGRYEKEEDIISEEEKEDEIKKLKEFI